MSLALPVVNILQGSARCSAVQSYSDLSICCAGLHLELAAAPSPFGTPLTQSSSSFGVDRGENVFFLVLNVVLYFFRSKLFFYFTHTLRNKMLEFFLLDPLSATYLG